MDGIGVLLLFLGLAGVILFLGRKRKCLWFVLVPAAGLQLFSFFLGRALFFVSPEVVSIFSQIVMSLNVGMAVLLVGADRWMGKSRMGTVVRAVGVLVLTGIAVILLNNGLRLTNKATAILVLDSILIPSLIGGLGVTFLMIQSHRNFGWFVFWLFFWFVVLSAGFSTVIMGVMFYVEGPAHDEWFGVFGSAFLFGLAMGGLLCVVASPYLILLFVLRSCRSQLDWYLKKPKSESRE